MMRLIFWIGDLFPTPLMGGAMIIALVALRVADRRLGTGSKHTIGALAFACGAGLLCYIFLR